MRDIPSQVWVGAAVTTVVLLFAFIAAMQPIQSEMIGEVTRWHELMASPGNELGDALAGIAGSLAFVWLIVTVLLQSKELRLQREEITLTRSEIEGQRKATEDMARSLAAQAGIFEMEAKERLQASAASELEQQYVQLRSLMLGQSGFWMTEISHADGGKTHTSVGLFNGQVGQTFDEFFELTASQLGQAHRAFTQDSSRTTSVLSVGAKAKAIEILEQLDSVLRYKERLSPQEQMRMGNRRIAEMRESLAGILQNVCWVDDK